MNTPIAIATESARGEILNAIGTINEKYGFAPCIIDGILSSVLADVRAQEKMSIVNAAVMMLDTKEEEINKIKKEAKKTLKNKDDNVPEKETEEK